MGVALYCADRRTNLSKMMVMTALSNATLAQLVEQLICNQ